MVDQTQEINKKGAWELATNAPDNVSQELSLPLEMTFNEGHVVSIITYSILMVIAAAGNITVLVILLRRRKSGRSRINTMVMHLAIADLMVPFIDILFHLICDKLTNYDYFLPLGNLSFNAFRNRLGFDRFLERRRHSLSYNGIFSNVRPIPFQLRINLYKH